MDNRTKQMRSMRFDQHLTLQEIADHFGGLSRERVRQILGNTGKIGKSAKRRIYERNRHLSNKELAELMHIKPVSVSGYRSGERHEMSGGYVKIGTDVENAVSKKLASLGIGHKLMGHHHPFDILLNNGVRVDVKSSSLKTYPRWPTPVYNFVPKSKRRGRYCDFFILVCQDTNDMFVVPYEDAKETIRFAWPKYYRASHWHKYHNRFDLLRTA
jgi:hypothetical protein